ncbi:MAG: hypothetical protein HYZ53_06060 [Planctomycetes bacterium]|nr:hypothetical protein [Planctomycetota bacterium]
MIIALEKFRQDEGGYGMAFAAFTLFSLVCFCAYTVNIADVTNKRTQMQNAADAGAYAGAVEQASMLTRIATLNIVMMVFYALFLVGFALSLIPFTKAIGEAIMTICELMLKLLNFLEKILAFVATFQIKSTAEDFATQNGADTVSTYGKDAIPVVLGAPPIAYMFADSDFEYMEPEDPDATRAAVKHSFLAIPISKGTSHKLDDRNHTMLVIKENFFENGVCVIAMKSQQDPILLGEGRVFFDNPRLKSLRFGSGQNMALASGRAFNSDVKHDEVDENFDNLVSRDWKPKLITLREGGGIEVLPLVFIMPELLIARTLFQH